MHRMGLTGGIASGKSTVAQMLQDAGAIILDADQIAHTVILPTGPAYSAVVETFGPSILQSDGQIDRGKLGALVFGQPQALQKLNACVHPHVRATIQARTQALAQEAQAVGKNWLLITVIPLLYENQLESHVEKVMVVYCPQDLQLKRLKQRNALTDIEARQRIQSQWPIEQKKERADWVIDNSGTVEQTQHQVKKWLGELSWDTYVV